MHLAYSPQHWLRHRSYCTSVLITGQWRLWTICQLILHLVLYRWWSRCHRPIRISQWAGLPNKWSWHGNQAVGHSWLEYGTHEHFFFLASQLSYIYLSACRPNTSFVTPHNPVPLSLLLFSSWHFKMLSFLIRLSVFPEKLCVVQYEMNAVTAVEESQVRILYSVLWEKINSGRDKSIYCLSDHSLTLSFSVY